MADLPVGSQFADYRIDGIAGRGGMGVVYRATDVVLQRPVALKLIAPVFAGDQAFRDRFLRESRLAAAIDHPGVVSVYRAGEVDGQLFLAMRFVEGTDLRQLIRGAGRVDPARAARIIAGVGEALDAAHAKGLVHRDVKPANVLIGDDGRVYLGDFGLTKDIASASGLTATGHMVGTPDYTAPEQIRGERVDARSDVYSLGCVLYEAVTGRLPYPQEGSVAKMYCHMNEPPPSAARLVPTLPPALDGVIQRAMAKDPADRPPSAGDLGRAALAAVGDAAPAGPERIVARGDAAPATPTEDRPLAGDTGRLGLAGTPPPPGGSRRRASAAIVAVLALVLIAGVAIAVALVAAGGDGEGTTIAEPPPNPPVVSTPPPAISPPRTTDEGPGSSPDPPPTPPPAVGPTEGTGPGSAPTDETDAIVEALPEVRRIVSEYDAGRTRLVNAVASVPRDPVGSQGEIAQIILQRIALAQRLQPLPDFPGKEDLARALQTAVEADRAYADYARSGDTAERDRGDRLSAPVVAAKNRFRAEFNRALTPLGEEPIPDF